MSENGRNITKKKNEIMWSQSEGDIHKLRATVYVIKASDLIAIPNYCQL
jgi:hypothetical protein